MLPAFTVTTDTSDLAGVDDGLASPPDTANLSEEIRLVEASVGELTMGHLDPDLDVVDAEGDRPTVLRSDARDDDLQYQQGRLRISANVAAHFGPS